MAIIKCPVCNKNVSTLAIKCPSCGTDIANNITICSECGEANLNDNDTCHNCGVALNSALSPENALASKLEDEQPDSQADTQPSEEEYEIDATTADETETDNKLEPEEEDTYSQTDDDQQSYDTTPQEHDPLEDEPQAIPPTPASDPEEEDEEEYLDMEEDEEDEDTENYQSKSKHTKRTILIWLIVLIILAAAAVFGYLYYQDYKAQQQEENDYALLIEKFSVKDAETFLAKHPDNKNKKKIKEKIAVYKRQEQEWNNISEIDNKDELFKYIDHNPNSPFVENAMQKIDSIDWVIAKEYSTQFALDNYIKVHPQGKYVQLAKQGTEALAALRVTSTEKAYISAAIMKFFIALTSNKKDYLPSITTQQVNNSTCQLIDNQLASNTTSSYAFLSSIKVDKTSLGDSTMCTASCKVLRTTTDKEGSGTKKTFAVKAAFTTDLKITAIGLKSQSMPEE